MDTELLRSKLLSAGLPESLDDARWAAELGRMQGCVYLETLGTVWRSAEQIVSDDHLAEGHVVEATMPKSTCRLLRHIH